MTIELAELCVQGTLIMEFKPNPKANSNGCALAKCIDISDSQLKRAFGDYHRDWDFDEPEKGYGPWYGFEADDGQVITLYTRFGKWRIGAIGAWGKDNELVTEFERWLCQQLGD